MSRLISELEAAGLSWQQRRDFIQKMREAGGLEPLARRKKKRFSALAQRITDRLRKELYARQNDAFEEFKEAVGSP